MILILEIAAGVAIGQYGGHYLLNWRLFAPRIKARVKGKSNV